MKTYKLSILAILSVFVQNTAADQIYQCKQKDGSTAYQDRPCENQTLKVRELKVLPQSDRVDSSKTDGKVTKSKLYGTWSNMEKPSDVLYRTIWTFSATSLTIKRHTGHTFSRDYVLKDNLLIIQHPKDEEFSQNAWSEKLEILDISGNKLKWGDSGPVGEKYLYKLY